MCFLLENAITIYSRTFLVRIFHPQAHTHTVFAAVGKWTNESNLSISNRISHCGSMAIKLNLLCIHKVEYVIRTVRWLQCRNRRFYMTFLFPQQSMHSEAILCRHPFHSLLFRVKSHFWFPKNPIAIFSSSLANCYFLFQQQNNSMNENGSSLAFVMLSSQPLDTLALCFSLGALFAQWNNSQIAKLLHDSITLENQKLIYMQNMSPAYWFERGQCR